MSLLKTIGQDVKKVLTTAVDFIDKEAPVAEAFLNAFVPLLPQLEKEAALIIANAAAGDDIEAAEELIALIAQIKANMPKT